MNSKETVRLTVKRLYPGLHPLKQTAAQTIKDLREILLYWKKRDFTVNECCRRVLKYLIPIYSGLQTTVLCRSVHCCPCKQASHSNQSKHSLILFKKTAVRNTNLIFIQNKVKKLFPRYHGNHLSCKIALVQGTSVSNMNLIILQVRKLLYISLLPW